MFQDLDTTLEAMLNDPAAPADLRNADVSFDTPDKDYKPDHATVNLFLHDLAENRDLRDTTRVVERNGDVYASRPPPLRVDCTYLTTAWSAKPAAQKVEEEHRLLGLALSWLSRFPVIEDRFLEGKLKNPPQPYPLPAVVAQVKEGQGLGHFWSALGVPPRPAFSLTVTITVQPSDQVEQYPVTEKVLIEHASLTHPRLSGRVLDHDLAPVPSARVSVVGTGLETTVDPSGAFAFAGLDFGAPHPAGEGDQPARRPGTGRLRCPRASPQRDPAGALTGAGAREGNDGRLRRQGAGRLHRGDHARRADRRGRHQHPGPDRHRGQEPRRRRPRQARPGYELDRIYRRLRCLQDRRSTCRTPSAGSSRTAARWPTSSRSRPDGLEGALDQLTRVPEVSMVCVPGLVDAAAQATVITHCETMGDRIAILDGAPDPTPLKADGALQKQRGDLLSKGGFAALYWPWIVMRRPGGHRRERPRWRPCRRRATSPGSWPAATTSAGCTRRRPTSRSAARSSLAYTLNDTEQGALNRREHQRAALFPRPAAAGLGGQRP